MLLYNRTQPNRNTIIIRSQLRNNNVAKHLATAKTNDFLVVRISGLFACGLSAWHCNV